MVALKEILIQGSHGQLNIHKEDKAAMKFAMLIEGCQKGVSYAIKKYGYTEQRYYQLLKAYKNEGFNGLIDKSRGPKSNRVRTEVVINQIIRHRFLDPDASAALIAQKMSQAGYPISERSVERTITEYGLQKKTSRVKTEKHPKTNRDT